MSTMIKPEYPAEKGLPTHLDLPESDGAIVENFQEHSQVSMLTQAIRPILEQLHPNQDYCIGMDSGIYFRITDPPLNGCRSPDWFYVPGVPKRLPDSDYRRSYVLWQERQPPLLIIEIVSGDGSVERDRTPETGKFWIYERAIQSQFYGIFDPSEATLEVYERVQGRYQQRVPNSRGHYVIAPLGVALGIWEGVYWSDPMPWVRFYDLAGNLLPHDLERAQQFDLQARRERERAEAEKEQVRLERERAEMEKQRADSQQQRADMEKQRAEAEKQRADMEKQRVEMEKQRAEAEKEKADRLAAKLRELGIDPEQLS